jgi:hypothetical protein
MKRDINEIVEQEINEVINPLLTSWGKKTEKEVEDLLKKLGKICRDETSKFRNETLSNVNLAEELLKIGGNFKKNTTILVEIVSSINNMHERYKLIINENIFNFLLHQTKNKKVNFYVSLFITELPQFENYTDNWLYIMSIPNIAPKEKSINTFFRIISNKINSIPDKFKPEIVNIFEEYAKKENLHKSTVDKYKNLVQMLNK